MHTSIPARSPLILGTLGPRTDFQVFCTNPHLSYALACALFQSRHVSIPFLCPRLLGGRGSASDLLEGQ